MHSSVVHACSAIIPLASRLGDGDSAKARQTAAGDRPLRADPGRGRRGDSRSIGDGTKVADPVAPHATPRGNGPAGPAAPHLSYASPVPAQRPVRRS
jgi:hypothetical protein